VKLLMENDNGVVIFVVDPSERVKLALCDWARGVEGASVGVSVFISSGAGRIGDTGSVMASRTAR